MTLRWLGQSGYLLRDEKTVLCIDPYLSDAVNRAANRPRLFPPPVRPEELWADAVICTHNHLDHLDVDAISRMQKDAMTFYAPSDCQATLIKVGVRHYVPFDEENLAYVGGFCLKAVFANHTIPAIGILVEYHNRILYFTGDTYYHEKLREIRCDALFVCINGRLGNMNVSDAIRLIAEIQPKVAVPNHYGMFESNTENPENFQVPQRFIMELGREYKLEEIIQGGKNGQRKGFRTV